MNKIYNEALFYHDVKMFLGEEFLLMETFYDLLNGFMNNYYDEYREEFEMIKPSEDPKEMFKCLIRMEDDRQLLKILDKMDFNDVIKIGNLATAFVEYIYIIYDSEYTRIRS